MKMSYVVLRGDLTEEQEATRGSAGAHAIRATPAARAKRDATPLKVEVDQLKPADAADLRRRAGVVAVAPIMRMKLIEPVAVPGAAASADSSVAWGVRAVKAHESQYTGKGVVVAVLDTGIDPNHSAFAGVNLKRRNFTDAGDDDSHGHGTHCAGTIFGRDVDGMRIGVAPGVTDVLIGKVLGGNGGGSDKVVQAIQWAVGEGAHVISMSLGIDFPGFVKELEGDGLTTEAATSMALEGYRANVRLFERLAALVSAQADFGHAMLLTAAAGNESDRPAYIIAASPPAVAEGFVSVAAVGQTPQGLDVANFSNTGARVCAPGVAIQSAKRGGGLKSMNGTSMATPHVAGVAALWVQKLMDDNQLNQSFLDDKLVASATMQGLKPGLEFNEIGAGIVQAP